MSELFLKKVEVIVEGLDKKLLYPDLDIFFEGDFADDGDPNFYSCTIYNLSNDTISKINKNDAILINAGYGNNLGLATAGVITKVETTDEGVDKATIINIQDGSKEWLEANISETFTGPVDALTILNNIVSGIGLNLGSINLVNNIVYQTGKTVYGKLSNVIRQIAEKECGSNVIISNGNIDINTATQGFETGFLLNESSGLLNKPTKIDDKDSQAEYRIQMLFNANIKPRSIIQLESNVVSGFFMVLRGNHSKDFVTEVELVSVEVNL